MTFFQSLLIYDSQLANEGSCSSSTAAGIEYKLACRSSCQKARDSLSQIFSSTQFCPDPEVNSTRTNMLKEYSALCDSLPEDAPNSCIRAVQSERFKCGFPDENDAFKYCFLMSESVPLGRKLPDDCCDLFFTNNPQYASHTPAKVPDGVKSYLLASYIMVPLLVLASLALVLYALNRKSGGLLYKRFFKRDGSRKLEYANAQVAGSLSRGGASISKKLSPSLSPSSVSASNSAASNGSRGYKKGFGGGGISYKSKFGNSRFSLASRGVGRGNSNLGGSSGGWHELKDIPDVSVEDSAMNATLERVRSEVERKKSLKRASGTDETKTSQGSFADTSIVIADEKSTILA